MKIGSGTPRNTSPVHRVVTPQRVASRMPNSGVTRPGVGPAPLTDQQRMSNYARFVQQRDAANARKIIWRLR